MKTLRRLAIFTLPTIVSLSAVPAYVMAASNTPPVTPASSASSTGALSTNANAKANLLQMGDSGASVVLLQKDLNLLGYSVGTADGSFGPMTKSQVKAFQASKHMTTDGVVGPSTWAAIQTALTALGQTVTPASSPPSVKPVLSNLGVRTIQVSGQTMESPYGFVANGTTYMPIWYVMQALNHLGITSTWSKHKWNLMLPPTSTVTKFPHTAGTGVVSISVNQNVVFQANPITHVDPASKNIVTTYLPIWDIQQALNLASIQSLWDGSTWNMSVVPASATGGDGNTPNSGNNSTGNSLGNSTGNSLGNSTGNSTGNTSGGTPPTPPSNQTFASVDLRYAAPNNITAPTIDAYLQRHHASMTGLGASFIAAQATYGVDANYLVSHAILESYWGNSQIALAKNNLYGYGAYDSNPGSDAGLFPTEDYAIRFQAWEVRNNYLNPGSSEFVSPTLIGMNVHYATDQSWATNIGQLMNQLASSENDSVASYTQYTGASSAPTPQSTTEPTFTFNGAEGVVQPTTNYTGLPYYSSMGVGMSQMFFGPLQNGSHGSAVAAVQSYLNQHMKANLQVDGQFGQMTGNAIKAYQAAQGMAQTGIWNFAMWSILYPTPTQLLPTGGTVHIDQVMQGLAGGIVTMWYHVVGYGWVDSQYIQLSNVYRLLVPSPATPQATVNVYNPLNPTQLLTIMHSGDFVVSSVPGGANGQVVIAFANQATGQMETGLIQTSQAVLTQQK